MEPFAARFQSLPLSRFLLTRHGRCEANTVDRLPEPAAPLDDVGRGQARQAARLLTDTHLLPTHIVHSTLARSVETAHIVGHALGVRSRAEPRLNEMDFGAARGMTGEEFERAFPDHARRIRDAGDLAFAWPRGEGRRHFLTRLWQALSAARDSGSFPLVVTHWTACGMVRACLTRGTLADWVSLGLDNCEVWLLARDGPPTGETPARAWREQRIHNGMDN